jgi:hypothetical protein
LHLRKNSIGKPRKQVTAGQLRGPRLKIHKQPSKIPTEKTNVKSPSYLYDSSPPGRGCNYPKRILKHEKSR